MREAVKYLLVEPRKADLARLVESMEVLPSGLKESLKSPQREQKRTVLKWSLTRLLRR